MPIAAMATMQSLPGVAEVAPRAYFMGVYRELGAKNMAAAIATYPEIFLRMLPSMGVSKSDLEALRADRAGMLATTSMLQFFGLACTLGLAGGLVPAVRAARSNIADSLHET
jgi:hypothetical protein